ncbi:MAG: aminomethyl-transferring glycine dehydrogenase subunit GcvPA [Candidatus Hodarchaeales archaeon]|jgi:glycine dehydrogenase subunit 1
MEKHYRFGYELGVVAGESPMENSSRFVHPFLPQTESQIKTMLESIGTSNIEDLFSGIPENLRFSDKLGLPDSHTEQETLSEVRRILQKNISLDKIPSFLGVGIYHHYIPAAVSAILNRSEFFTSYTPYAPEISQGMLQSLWEYQSMVSELTRLDLVNSSMYDMATALGEAALMCTRVTRKEIFLVPSYLQPEKFQTLQTYAQGPEISIKTYPFDQKIGIADIEVITEIFNSHKGLISGIYIENPNFWGIIEENVKEIGKIAHIQEALLVTGIDPISLGMLIPPGDYGADIAIGEGQSLGLPMNFGGPLLGLFAVRKDKKLTRAMPGRIIGLTTEKQSDKRAFTMTLQTREQHIRREKATSNICTNNALCALASAVFLSLIGPSGLKQLAELCMARTAYLMEELGMIKGINSPYFTGTPFKEFVFQLDSKFSQNKFESFILANKIQGGFPLQSYFPELGQSFLSTVTDMTSLEDINQYTQVIRDFVSKRGGS